MSTKLRQNECLGSFFLVGKHSGQNYCQGIIRECYTGI